MVRKFGPLVAAGSVAVVLVAALMLNAEDAPAPDAAAQKVATPTYPDRFKSLETRVSYAIGVDLGSNFKSLEVNLDPKMLSEGAHDALYGDRLQLSDEQIQATMREFQQEVARRRATQQQSRASEEARDLAAFISTESAPAEFTQTASGLKYRVLKAGEGASPKPTSVVRVHYHGQLTDGTVFDSSVERGEAIEFPVNGVISGWTEALQLMNPGARFELLIPSDLAYGEQGAPPAIPANAELRFFVELISFR